MIEAELRALRAQISPHFVYNSLTAIASFVRTDPDRARDLLIEFADFTRYAFRRGGEFTTLADELTNIERYLVLEKARFGDRLDVRLRVAPEVLPVSIPFLSVQPLVENAVRHGLEGSEGDRPRDAGRRGRRHRGPDLGRGRRRGLRPRGGAARAVGRVAARTRSGSATSTRGCARCSATTPVSSSRPRRARAPGSRSACRSTAPGRAGDDRRTSRRPAAAGGRLGGVRPDRRPATAGRRSR